MRAEMGWGAGGESTRACCDRTSNGNGCRSRAGVQQVGVDIHLRQQELVVAQVVAQAFQRLAERRAVAGAVDLGMLAQQLAQQGRAGARQPRDIDDTLVEFECVHRE